MRRPFLLCAAVSPNLTASLDFTCNSARKLATAVRELTNHTEHGTPCQSCHSIDAFVVDRFDVSLNVLVAGVIIWDSEGDTGDLFWRQPGKMDDVLTSEQRN